jgi:hypothetical protein
MVGLADRAQQVHKLLADLNRGMTHLRLKFPFHFLFSPIFSWPVLLPGLTGVWFLLRPGNLSQWCGTIQE